ncbi:hypothetical protein GCM10011380_09060 [Sphingomonas metalli]|uniref:Uncharacterized protein n=2 Tax=Sphingomonas metalli TaxID=1779358 RepID=A0A916WR05_9SPHN|nr:hypothetical protein GCM10011380_09060 [Sphingomonas metalli]
MAAVETCEQSRSMRQFLVRLDCGEIAATADHLERDLSAACSSAMRAIFAVLSDGPKEEFGKTIVTATVYDRHKSEARRVSVTVEISDH